MPLLVDGTASMLSAVGQVPRRLQEGTAPPSSSSWEPQDRRPRCLIAGCTFAGLTFHALTDVWAFERQAGRYGVGLRDRVLRFVGGSSLLVAVLAGPLYTLYVRFAGKVAAAEPLPWWLAVIPVIFVSLPLLAGTILGLAVRRGWDGVRWLTGPDLAPRAWDHLFQYDIDGWVRCRMKSGTWLGGAFAEANGKRSYAAGYPEDQDLYLAATVEVDPESGVFIVGDDGLPVLQASGLLVRWEEVEYLEFTNA